MADQITPFGLPTTNYGWTKPSVGADQDVWGGMINADLDGIDSTVKAVSNSVPAAAVIAPVMDGTAAVGSSPAFARSDHVHPTDTSRYATSNPAGYQTAAQVAALIAAQPVAMNDNRIINGDMRIDQRNAGASGTSGGPSTTAYPVDRWIYYATQASKGTWGRILNAVVSAVGFPYYLGFQSSSAYAPIATDGFGFWQAIEADQVGDLAWGTVNALAVTLSFWVRSSLIGTFGAAIQNYAQTRSYPFTYSIPVANTWTKIVVIIPGDTAGTWISAGPGGAVYVIFDLGSGTTLRGLAGAWATTTPTTAYQSATGAVSVVGTNAATFYVTGVKLEIGSVATPYNRQSLAKSMADCQRYYQVFTSMTIGGYNTTSGNIYATLSCPPMRAAPTVALSGQSYGNASSASANGMQPSNLWFAAAVTATGQASATFNAALNAEL